MVRPRDFLFHCLNLFRRHFFRLFFTLAIFALISVPLFGLFPDTSERLATSARKLAEDLKASLDDGPTNPFEQFAPQPPRQKNDNFQGSTWLADWKWVTVPFSSSVTQERDRALLPPLTGRTPIYCYYDSTIKKPQEEKDAEDQLLTTWKKAWWAIGFRPILLTATDAIHNPLYQRLNVSDMQEGLRAELMRLLAWDTMGAGLLSHYTLLPMVAESHPFITFMKRAAFTGLTRWQVLGHGLYASPPQVINSVLRDDINPDAMAGKALIDELIPEKFFSIEQTNLTLAYYNDDTIEKKYPRVSQMIQTNRSEGLTALNQLMNAHSINAWQNRFSGGIEVLKPHPRHMTTIIAEGVKLASALAACPDTPLPSTCPPNLPECTPCVAMSPMKVTTPPRYHNSSTIFTIGTVPHPWSFQSLDNMKDDINITWIREESFRDVWISLITQDLLGSGVTSEPRLLRFKRAVGEDGASENSVWYTTEVGQPRTIEWQLGFAIPKTFLDTGMSLSPVPADRVPKKDLSTDPINGPIATPEDLEAEEPLLEKAKALIASTRSNDATKLRASLEAWNLADIEAWRFTKAFQARKRLEWKEWRKDDRKFTNQAGLDRWKTAFSGWRDDDNE